MNSSKYFTILALLNIINIGRAGTDISQDIRSTRVILDAQIKVSKQNKAEKADSTYRDVLAGEALDLFFRFGFYSLNMRVVPQEDSGIWLLREPTIQIFDDSTVVQIDEQGTNSFHRQPFQIFLCEDLNEVYEAYFSEFQVEGIDQPHKVFTGSWSIPVAAKYFSLSPNVLSSDAGFVLIKFIKPVGKKIVAGNLSLNVESRKFLKRTNLTSEDTVLEFIQQFGSHFIQKINVGDVIFQVLAISREQFLKLERIIGDKVGTLEVSDWNIIYDLYLSPSLVRQAGGIKTTSGNVALQKFLNRELRVRDETGSHPQLVESLIRNQSLVNQMEELSADSAAISGFTLSSLRYFIENPMSQRVFDDTIQNLSALFEINV